MTKPPKMIVNPEYLSSEYGRRELEEAKDSLVASREQVQDYFPEEYGKQLPPDGGWIMILLSVHVGKQLPKRRAEKIEIPHLSIWFAKPTVTNFTRRVGSLDLPLTKAVIQTPQGEVCIWPHEYQIVDLQKYLEFGEEDGFYIHFMHPETQGFDEAKLFYLRSRGLSKAAAQRILLPELKDPNFCYFTFHEDYGKFFGDGCSVPVRL